MRKSETFEDQAAVQGRLDYILFWHALSGQACGTRYFAKKQNELKQTFLSFVQL